MNLFQGIIDIYDENSIDLDKAWSVGIRAILHQATRGTYRKDKEYAERKKIALARGFLWAGYHLLSGEDIDQQLNNFLSMEDGSDPRVGMAIDWEPSKKGLASGNQVRAFVQKFNAAMKPRYADRYPILYGGQQIRNDSQIAQGDPLLAKCPLWYVRYNAAGPLGIPTATWPTYSLWQYDDEKRNYGAPSPNILPGADFNRYQGTEEELRLAWPFGGIGTSGSIPVHPMTGNTVTPVIPLVQGFAGKAIAIAIQEWDFFGKQTRDVDGHTTHPGHTEGEDGWYQRVGIYWKEGVHVNGIDGRNHDIPWSAAFISWVMRTASAGTKFHYSEGHSHYIYPAIIAKRNGDVNAGYWCYRLNEMKPEIGDLICLARQADIDYDHQSGGDYKGHCDLVVAVSNTQIEVIGGNVGDSVTRRPVALNAQGFLWQHEIGGELLFGLMKNRII